MISFQSLGERRLLVSSYAVYEVADDKNRTITKKYIEENFAAMHVELTPEESQHIRDLVEKASVFGDRWPPEHGLGLFADTPLPEKWKDEKKDVTIGGRLILDQE
jgi:hypothetical protein